MADASLLKMFSDECHWSLIMMSQHWFRQLLGAVRQQAIVWANVDPDLSPYGVTKTQWVKQSYLSYCITCWGEAEASVWDNKYGKGNSGLYIKTPQKEIKI